MKRILTFKSFIFLTLLSVFILSCDNDKDELMTSMKSSSTIVETAQGEDSLSSLVAALVKADENENSDLIGTLSENGPFTVFAPTNEAFSALLQDLEGFDSLEDFNTEEEKELLATILQYHVVAGVAAASTDLSEGQTITTVQGENISISIESGVFIGDATMEDAKVVGADVQNSNGIVHIINKVLLPQEILNALNPPQDLVDLVITTEALSSLEVAVIKADLVETLKSEGPFTVFAPTDAAFTGLLMALGDDYNSLDDFDTDEEIALLRDILLFHVIPAKILATDLAEGEVETALAENSVEIIAEGDTFVIGDASDTNVTITGTDIMATNGVTHTINKVLLPQSAIDFVASLQMKNIVELAIATDDLSILVDALVAANAGLVETLSGDGPFTIFAPTNDAFVGLLDILGDDYNALADFDSQEEIDLLVKILTYHVVAGTEAFAADLSDGQSIATVNGASVGINLKNGTVHVVDATDDNATVVIPDVDASNGVVHVINKVLLPQEAVDFVANLQMKNIVELAIATDDLSILVDALVAANAGLVETLSGDGPFTVFAPTNDAFVGLLDILGDDYNALADFDSQEEIDLLVKILTYHVVAGTEAFAADLSDGQSIATVNGASVGINLKNETVHVVDATNDNATVVIPNIDATNGVIHVINKVLLPQEAVDFVTSMQTPNIVELAQSVDDLSLLVDALIQADAGLVEALSGEGPFTVFAPTNKAFANLLHQLGSSYNSLSDFDTPAEKALLAKILTYHVVAGAAVASTDLKNHQEFTTLQGESIFAILNHEIFIRDKTHVDAKVTGADNISSNGIVHIINKVLLPQEVLDALH
ncbi:fasciclin domain-containing protein [uncultured Croceitalea sp.]|uniref:fasciclin domain-containing protein n=1 Tax=uncultured Croceitalea sp. TaxID=1798908 RepID=UPI00374FCE33